MKHQFRRNRTGASEDFTLIELLVVISIIAILASMLLPTLNHARSLARATDCRSRIRSIGMAWNDYASDTQDFILPIIDAGKNQCFSILLKNGYLSGLTLPGKTELPGSPQRVTYERMLMCPSAQNEWGNYQKNGYSYGYNSQLPLSYGYNLYFAPQYDTPPLELNNVRNIVKLSQIRQASQAPAFGDTWKYSAINATDTLTYWWFSSRYLVWSERLVGMKAHANGNPYVFADMHVGIFKSPYEYKTYPWYNGD